jgi:internalin A
LSGLPPDALDAIHVTAFRVTEPDFLVPVAQLTGLQRFELMNMGLPDGALRPLSALNELRCLHLDGRSLPEPGWDVFRSATKLRVLKAWYPSWPATQAAVAAEWRDLEVADVMGDAVSDDVLAYLCQCPRLHMLGFFNSPVRDVILPRLEALRELDSLYLGNVGLTDTSLTTLASLHQLRSLGIGKSAVSDQGMSTLAKLVDLEYLGVHEAPVTDDGVRALKPLQNLRSLQLSGTQITDAALSILTMLSRLESLDLRDCAITDRGLGTLAGRGTLRSLDLTRTRTSLEARARFRLALPECKIYPDP